MKQFHITWREVAEAIGYRPKHIIYDVYGVKVRLGSDSAWLVGDGSGKTEEEAIESALSRLNINYMNVKKKLEDKKWAEYDKILAKDCERVCHY